MFALYQALLRIDVNFVDEMLEEGIIEQRNEVVVI